MKAADMSRVAHFSDLHYGTRTLAEPDVETFLGMLPGQTIQTVGRRAKFLTLTLSESTMVIHLRMSGDLKMNHPKRPSPSMTGCC